MGSPSNGLLRVGWLTIAVGALGCQTPVTPSPGEAPAEGAPKVSPLEEDSREAPPKISPFSAVRWTAAGPEVLVNTTWYQLHSINHQPIEGVIEFCKETFGTRWRRRIELDLVEVLDRMSHPTGRTVDLEVQDLETGAITTLVDVSMTEENRQDTLERRWRWRVKREHSNAVPSDLRFLQDRFHSTLDGAARTLTREEAEDDLDQMEWLLEHRHSYLRWKGVDYRAALDAVRAGLGDGIDAGSFAIQIQKVLALFGDGHGKVRSYAWKGTSSILPSGYTPFLLGEVGGRLVALEADRSDFVDPDHPYLKSMDALEMDEWLRAAAETVPRGSPQYIREGSVTGLLNIQYLRQELGLAETDTIRLVLESEDGGCTRVKEVRVAEKEPDYGEWPDTDHGLLPGNIGYLRIAKMSGSGRFRKGLAKAMDMFRETRGLIIDVRGNSGGDRKALRSLFPYFMGEQDPPHVATVAAYRLPRYGRPPDPEEYLKDRFMYPASSGRWNREERDAIGRAASRFVPEWIPPQDQFSPWHYFLLSRPKGWKRYHYDRPVIILMDPGCFSATDTFLGAFKGWEGVTLMGTPSRGGSGRAKWHALQHSRIMVKLSSMASFRPDGRMYDGRGIQPDVLVEPVLTDLIGRTDSVLDAAIEKLR